MVICSVAWSALRIEWALSIVRSIILPSTRGGVTVVRLTRGTPSRLLFYAGVVHHFAVSQHALHYDTAVYHGAAGARISTTLTRDGVFRPLPHLPRACYVATSCVAHIHTAHLSIMRGIQLISSSRRAGPS